MSNGKTASYAAGSSFPGLGKLEFTYTVGAGDDAVNPANLAISSYDFGTIKDASGNLASVTGAPTALQDGGNDPFTVDTTAPAAPVIYSVELSGGTWFVTGSADANSTVTIFDGGTQVGQTTADGSGNWSVNTTASDTVVRNLTAKATDAAGNIGAASAAVILGTPGNDTFSFASEAVLAAPVLILGNGGSDTIAMTAASTLTDADFASAVGVQTLSVTGNSAVTLGADASATGITSVNASGLTTGQTLTLNGSDSASVSTGAGNLSAGTYTGNLSVTTGSGTHTITTGSGDDTITSGEGYLTGAETLSGGAGNDTFILQDGAMASGGSIDGGTGTDTIQLSGPTNVDGINLYAGTVTGVEAIAGSNSADIVQMSPSQWTAFGSIDLGAGFDRITVIVDGTADISGGTIPSISNVEFGNLDGGGSDDTLTLTGAELNAILIGGLSGASIDMGGGNDTLNLTSTSTALATLGANSDALIAGLENISVANATSGVTLNLRAQSEAFTITGSANNDTITGGSGADTINAGTGDDTINGFVGADHIDGGAGTDTIALTGTSTDLNAASDAQISNVEAVSATGAGAGVTVNLANQSDGFTITGSTGADSITGSSGNDTIIGNGGSDTLSGGGGDDLFKLSNANLGTIASIGGGTGSDTVQLTDTAGITVTDSEFSHLSGVETLKLATTGTTSITLSTSAAADAAGGTLTIDDSAGTGNLTVNGNGPAGNSMKLTAIGGSGNDTLIASNGTDTLTGGGGADIFQYQFGESPLVFGGSGTSGTVTGLETITDFTPGSTASSDKIVFPGGSSGGTTIGALTLIPNTSGTPVAGTASTLDLHNGQTVKRYEVTNGVMTFDTNSSGTFAPVALTSLSDVAAAAQFLENNFSVSGGPVTSFTATIGGKTHTYVYRESNAAANGMLIDLQNVSVSSLSIDATQTQITVNGTNTMPAGIAGSPIDLALTDPSGSGASVTYTITGMPEGWSLNQGSANADGTWTVTTGDPSSLAVTTPDDYTGATALKIDMSWTNTDGSVGSTSITDNVEVYPASPIFAVSGDDTLTGSAGNDEFVFAQPIGNDHIDNFDTARDKIDLIGFGVSAFSGLQIANDSGGNAVVTLGSGQSITLVGIDTAALSASNFVFDEEPVSVNSGTRTIGDGAILPLGGTIENSGTIALNSTGGETDLEILVRGATFTGGGNLTLSDNSANAVFGGDATAILDNADNTISGAGKLGAGSLTLRNEGLIEATGSNALVIDTGSNAVVNAGMVEADGSGGLVVKSTLTGCGVAQIGGASSIEFAAGSDAAVSFTKGATGGKLTLGEAENFTGSISGFTGYAVIDLGDIVDGSGTTLGYAANADGTGGTLTVGDATHSASLTLLGQYAAGDFATAADTNGGTVVTLADPSQSHSVIASHS